VSKSLPISLEMTYLYEPEITVDVASEECVALTDHDQLIVDPMKSGFIWYTPPLASTTEHSTGGQTWQIAGHDMQVLTMTLPGQTDIVTEVGSFMFGSPDIKMNVELTLLRKGGGGCSEGWKRICGGESCVKLLLHNENSADGYVGITPNFPAKIIPIKVITKMTVYDMNLLHSNDTTSSLFWQGLCNMLVWYTYR
jgi:Mitochondrial biogenesis AIM24